MRRALIYLVIALIVGGAVGTLMSRDPGYVLVSYENMSVETSLWFALLALIVGYFVLRVVIGLSMRLIRTGAGVALWQQNRRARVAQARTVRGLLLAGEGDWPGARKALAADAEVVDLPLVNYLGAARAANEIGDAPGRDALLQKASESTPGATLAVGLTQAELQISAQQYSAAMQTLSNLQDDITKSSACAAPARGVLREDKATGTRCLRSCRSCRSAVRLRRRLCVRCSSAGRSAWFEIADERRVRKV